MRSIGAMIGMAIIVVGAMIGTAVKERSTIAISLLVGVTLVLACMPKNFRRVAGVIIGIMMAAAALYAWSVT